MKRLQNMNLFTAKTGKIFHYLVQKRDPKTVCGYLQRTLALLCILCFVENYGKYTYNYAITLSTESLAKLCVRASNFFSTNIPAA